jgi:hypothetical protein
MCKTCSGDNIKICTAIPSYALFHVVHGYVGMLNQLLVLGFSYYYYYYYSTPLGAFQML